MTDFDDLDAGMCSAVMGAFGGVEVVIEPSSVGGAYTARAFDPERGADVVRGVFTEGTEHQQMVGGRDAAMGRTSGPTATVWLPPDQALALTCRPQREDRVTVAGRRFMVARVSSSDRADMLLTLSPEAPE